MLYRADTREQRLVTRLHLKLWQRIRLAFKFFWKFGDTNENRAGERESSVLVHTAAFVQMDDRPRVLAQDYDLKT